MSTIETLKKCLKYVPSGVFIVNFEYISLLFLMFILFTLSMDLPTELDYIFFVTSIIVAKKSKWSWILYLYLCVLELQQAFTISYPFLKFSGTLAIERGQFFRYAD